MSFLKNRTVIGVICIVLSLVICFGVTPLFNRSMSQKVEIVRVVKDIHTGDEITKDMVQTVEVGGYHLPDEVLREADTVIGRFACGDLMPGDYILSSKIADAPAAENAYLYHLNGEKQAISVTVKAFANGLSGKLMSGDIVSVIAPDYRKQGATVIPAELQYVEVIAVTANSGYDANTGEESEEEDRELPGTVTLLVSPEQSKVLAELEADGKLHLSLVYRGTRENAEKFIEAQEELLFELYASEEDETKGGKEESPEEEVVEGTENVQENPEDTDDPSKQTETVKEGENAPKEGHEGE
ncbi:Flp pilus assembly protein CpaB [bacterium 1XD21-13]|nr:Flp pilus assembly protein CpaB [bacterium 1XD21-13]